MVPIGRISLPSIAIVDGAAAIDTARSPANYRLPRRIDGLDVQASFEYEPVHFTIGLSQLRFRGADPDLAVQQLTGAIAVREDNLYLERIVVKTGESALNVGGVIESYLRTPAIKLVANGTLSLPEVGRIVPVLSGYQLHPELVVRTSGTLDRLLMDLNLVTEAGLLRGPLTTDLRSPDFTFAGPFHVERLNLAPILKNPAQRSNITGDVRVDLTLPSNPTTTPVLERLGGTFTFSGPRVLALGYEAAQVRAKGSFKGSRITLSAGARARLRRLGDDSRSDRSAPGPAARVLRSAGHRGGCRPAAASRLDAGAEARHGAVTLRLPRDGTRHGRVRFRDAQPVSGGRRLDRTGHRRGVR